MSLSTLLLIWVLGFILVICGIAFLITYTAQHVRALLREWKNMDAGGPNAGGE
jgi:uncharacterized membrane protein HdeD (DUF308 family)